MTPSTRKRAGGRRKNRVCFEDGREPCGRSVRWFGRDSPLVITRVLEGVLWKLLDAVIILMNRTKAIVHSHPGLCKPTKPYHTIVRISSLWFISCVYGRQEYIEASYIICEGHASYRVHRNTPSTQLLILIQKKTHPHPPLYVMFQHFYYYCYSELTCKSEESCDFLQYAWI